jgi:outer membrane biogenesis lipoprotein LolB
MRPDPAALLPGRPLSRALIWAAVLVLMTGCAPAGKLIRLPPPLAPEDAAAAIDRALGINQGLRTFKGIGRLEIQAPQRRQTSRVAWAANLPQRQLRLDLIGAGLPMASLSSDGQRIYLRRHADGRLQTRSASDPSLDSLLGLPVTVGDVLCAMAGRLPDLAADRVSVHADEAAGGLMLVFHRPFGAPRAQVCIDAAGESLRRVTFYRFDGSLRYRIDYHDHRMVGSHRLPYRVEIRDAHTVCRIQVERWWTDVLLDDSVFVLKAAERPNLNP